jgi:pimeloyl-ACP methyl ester carboxylesterase
MNIAEFRAAKRHLDTPYGRIAYYDRGSGEPVVFLHGVPLNSAHWRDVIAELQSSLRCIAPDLMGLGDTEKAESSGLDFTSQAAMILDLLDRLDVGAFHLVGNDSGGAISQIIACTAPERLMSLTLTNCDVDANVPPPAFAQAFSLAKAGLLAKAIGLMRMNLTLARSDFGLGVGFENPRHITKDLVQAYLEPVLATPDRQSQLNRYVAEFDSRHTMALRERLAQLEVPTQILWATSDVFFPLADARWLARTIPGFRRLLEVEGARLFFCEERPDWAAGRIAEFIEGLPAAA